MPTIDLTITNEVGLHARPAALFVRKASSFKDCQITVQNITKGGRVVNAKSMVSVLTLGVEQGHQIRLEVNGDQAEEAISEIKGLVDANFGEEVNKTEDQEPQNQ